MDWDTVIRTGGIFYAYGSMIFCGLVMMGALIRYARRK